MDRLISEQSVLDTIKEWTSYMFTTPTGDLLKRIKAIPSAEPKVGYWINVDATHSKCNKCWAVFEIVSQNGEVNYCPNCGAKMVEPQESEVNDG